MEALVPDYNVEALFGDVYPTSGCRGAYQQHLLLDPGTATAPIISLHFESVDPLRCDFWVEIPSPGFCSDPCDPDMEPPLTGPEELCVQNCQDEPYTMLVDISWRYTTIPNGFYTYSAKSSVMDISTCRYTSFRRNFYMR